jgi:Uma2 family endonuclease
MSTQTLADPFSHRVPSDEPEVELLRGVEVPKVSPKRTHGVLQGELFLLLRAWAGTRGQVAVEWRFHLGGRAGEVTTLVPDVAFVATEAMTGLSNEEVEEPPFAPTVAVEIRSPGDRERNIRTKIALYLAAGSRLVLDVNPHKRCIVAHDRTGERAFTGAAIFEHPEVPGLSFDVAALFERAHFKR